MPIVAFVSGPGAASAIAGPPATIQLQLGNSLIAANGTSSTSALVTIDDSGGMGVPGETVSLGSTDGAQVISGPTDNGDGTYSFTITSSTTEGQSTITASDTNASLSTTQTLTQYGAAATVSLPSPPSPASITANGTSTSSISATVTDSQGDPVPGETLTFDSSPSGGPSGSFTDNGNGTYSGTITSTTHAGTFSLTVHDGAINSNTVSLTQTHGPAAAISITAPSPSSITANGTSTSSFTATVTDAHNNPVPGESLTFNSTPTGGPSGTSTSFTDNGDGTYSGTITSTTHAGTFSLTVHDGAINSNTKTLIQTPGPATSIALALVPSSIVASGTSTSAATATVTDAHGNGVPNEPVTLTTNGGQNIGSVTDNGDGTYSFTITSTTTVGQSTISAHDGALTPATAVLTETAAAAVQLSLALSPSTLVADGSSTTTATTTVLDTHGNGVPGETVTLTTSGSQNIGSVTDNGNGTYTATITSTTHAGQATITASVAGLPNAAQTLSQVAGPPRSITVALGSQTVVASGIATTTATATIADANQNGVTGQTVAFKSSDRRIHFGHVTDNGNGTYTTTLTGSTRAGAKTITATDQTAGPTFSAQTTLLEPTAPSMMNHTLMDWRFAYRPTFTQVLLLVLHGEQPGGTISIRCRGKGCPFAQRSIKVPSVRHCRRIHGHSSCTITAPGSLGLQSRFGKAHLAVGTIVTVLITKRGWIGKYYVIVIRPGTGPRISLGCLAPLSKNPKAGGC